MKERERERVLKASKDDNHPWDSWLLIIALLIEISPDHFVLCTRTWIKMNTYEADVGGEGHFASS